MELCSREFNRVYFETSMPAAVGDYLPRDGCNSVACPADTMSNEGIFPCTPCTGGRYTPYVGSVGGHCVSVHEKGILDTLYDDTAGHHWNDGAARWGNPNVPVCLYEGVDCNDSGHVVNITLRGMGLKGTIPGKLGRLEHLRRLILSDNQLYGLVPSDLRYPPLEELDLTGNQLQGPLPPLLCTMSGVNGNGVNGEFSCDMIVCPEGTFHWGGHTPTYQSSCIPCPGNKDLLGQTTCHVGATDLVSTVGAMSNEVNWSIVFGSLFGFGFMIVIAIFYVKRRVEQQVDGSSRSHGGGGGGDGLYNANGSDAFSAMDQEELTLMTYHRHSGGHTGLAPPEAGDPIQILPPSSGGGDVVAPPTGGESAIRQRRSPGPDDDPETQDLWLDVPKIA